MSSGHDWGDVFQDEPRKRIPEGMVLCPACKGDTPQGWYSAWESYCFICHNKGTISDADLEEYRRIKEPQHE